MKKTALLTGIFLAGIFLQGHAAENADTLTHAGMPEELLGRNTPTRFVAIKSNAIAWAATIMNIGGEIQLDQKITLSIPVWWCPWHISDNEALRVLLFQPEGRWWFNEPGKGHFAGVHATLAWYNLRHGDYRYQDKSQPALGAGITYGYSIPFARDWAVEFSVGAGFLSLRYERFHNVPNGARVDLRKTTYFGIDHAGITFSYRFSI